MRLNRWLYTSAFGFGVVGLLAFPGFETKGYTWGMVPGYWAAWLLMDWPGLEQQTAETLAGQSMAIVAGIEVWLCGWLMDRWNLSTWPAGVLLALVTLGFTWGYFGHTDDFSWWRYSVVSLVMPEGYARFPVTAPCVACRRYRRGTRSHHVCVARARGPLLVYPRLIV